MSFFDLIRDLRTSEPNVAKASKAMAVIGWVCLFIGAWNFIVPSLMPFDRNPFHLPPNYPVYSLVAFSFLCALFFLSSRGIRNGESWGKGLGQAAVVLLVVTIIGLLVVVFSGTHFPFSAFPAPVLIIFSILFVGQFIVPAWFGIRYLGRLPVTESASVNPGRRTAASPQPRAGAIPQGSQLAASYAESPFPFGAGATFIALLAVPMLGIFAALQVFGTQAVPVLFVPFFLLIFIGPVLYNRSTSSFEERRTILASYTGGGSIFLMNGSWPFFRLLVYADGVEIRFMFHRYFIPYDRMEDLPEKLGFFSTGVLFRSDLPKVPSSIRFYGFRSKVVLAAVQEQRKRFLAKNEVGI